MSVPPRALPLFLSLMLASAACQQRPAPVVAMEPRPNPPIYRPADNPRERLRQNRWLAQFWEELTPAQRRRVEARMRRAHPTVAGDRAGAALVWDGLGLAERDRLVFGGAAPPRSASASTAEPEGDKPTQTP